MIVIKNVLVATDFSPASDTALAYGRELARNFGATLHVLHVVENVYAYMVGTDAAIGAMIPSTLQAELEKAAQRQLDAVVGEDDRRELHAKAVLLTGNGAAIEIVTYARETGIDIIVVGTHGRGPMSHLLMGNVAEKVVRTAPCPVLTVRHPEHEFVLPDALVRVPRT
jgi:nucleotide-binding universal stress UspA family protein